MTLLIAKEALLNRIPCVACPHNDVANSKKDVAEPNSCVACPHNDVANSEKDVAEPNPLCCMLLRGVYDGITLGGINHRNG